MEPGDTMLPVAHSSDGQAKYLIKLLPILQQRGFSQLRIEDLVQAMDISKATFYKHFTSKEAVIEQAVRIVTQYFGEANAVMADAALPYVVRFTQYIEHTLIIATYLTDVFLVDLHQSFPALWERVKTAQRERRCHLEAFFGVGIAAGVFQPVPLTITLLQEETLLRALRDPRVLMEQELTVRSALEGYYDLQKVQWLVPAVRTSLDDAATYASIARMASKISLSIVAKG